MNDLDTYDAVSRVIARLEDRVASVEDVAEALGVLRTRKDQLRQMEQLFEDALLRHILATGPLTVGTIRYYAGVEKVTKCRDITSLVTALLVDHSVEDLVACLSSSAFKHGACREPLGDEWDQHFEVTERDALKEGKPQKTLCKADERWLK